MYKCQLTISNHDLIIKKLFFYFNIICTVLVFQFSNTTPLKNKQKIKIFHGSH